MSASSRRGIETLLVLHHSHTDVGYTARQSRVEAWQADFLRLALDIIDASATRGGEHFGGFKWVCETFWGVERWLERATPRDRDRFVAALRRGAIGLSASYLNFSELIDAPLLGAVTRRARAFGESVGVAVNSAMTADINGFGWGFSQVLADEGVDNLFACVHTHHGLYPLGETQVPFWWETPRGQRILVWNGEHYHFGNELGLVPGAVSSYLIKDECDAAMIFGDSRAVAEIRIPRYLDALAARGYPYDFLPLMASGLRTDNAPPSPRLVDFIERWNRERGEVVRIEMATLDDVFARLRGAEEEIPVHRGDWPDWWSDGPAGSAREVKLFRAAQRDLELHRALLAHGRDREGQPGNASRNDERLREVETDLALYAEHTFGHADAMTRPWDDLVQGIAARKAAYAARARDALAGLKDEALRRLGASALAPGRPLRYRALNPYDHSLSGPVRLDIGHFEFNERGFAAGAELRDARSGEDLPSRLETGPLGGAYCAWLKLAPGEERLLELAPSHPELEPTGDPQGAEEWTEVAAPSGALETEHLRLEWRLPDGLVSWRDRATGRELLRADRDHQAFTPVHEITPLPADGNVYGVRGAMGLNRKGADVQRSAGALERVQRGKAGELYESLLLHYTLPGTQQCSLELRAWRTEPRVDATLRLHKTSRREPENLYLSLPFTWGEGGQLWLDKAGAALRPRRDQIPGTLVDYYALQGGFALLGLTGGLALAMPDQHLLQVGPLAFGERLLAGGARLARDPERLYAWLMTNYWETNFAAELGGFHEFRYGVAWGTNLADREISLRTCRDLCRELPCFRVDA